MLDSEIKRNTLLRLSTLESLHNGRFKDFLKEVLIALTGELKVSRAGFWMYYERKEEIKSVIIYDKIRSSFTKEVAVLTKVDFPKFFGTVVSNPIISADYAENDRRTEELLDAYLKPNRIKSLLGVQVWNRGKLFGFISLEQTRDIINWTNNDEMHLAASASYITQAFNSQQRLKSELLRKQSEANYKVLFNDSPIPMWVYDHDTLQILDVNKRAVDQYGYSLNEFRMLKLRDLSPKSEQSNFEKYFEAQSYKKWEKSEWLQKRKDKSFFNAQISSDWTSYLGKRARIAMAIDVTQEKKMQKEKEDLITKLSDHAFYTSHNIRKPLSAILGLIDLIQFSWDDRENYEELLFNLKVQTMNLDEAIKVMNAKIELD